MIIALNPPSELQEFVEEAVKSGRFSNEKELVHEALETLRTREEFRQFQVAKLKPKLRAGLADSEAGRLAAWDGEEIKRQAGRSSRLYWQELDMPQARLEYQAE